MNYTVDQLTQAISKYNEQVTEGTKNSETRCTGIYLKLHGDGSSAITYQWASNSPRTRNLPFAERGAANLIGTIQLGDDRDTVQFFDTIEELYQFLCDKNVL